MWSSLRRSLPAIAGTSVFWIIVLGAIVLFGLRRPAPQPIQIVPPPPTTAPAAAAAPAPAAPTPGPLRVYVSGAVASPGVYRLPPDSLVDDAVKAAGGADPSADLVAINLAQTLADGDQIYVPVAGETPAPAPGASRSQGIKPATSAPSATSSPAIVDLNTATAAELEALPEIGPKTAAAIVAGRPYGSVDDLLRVKGIGEATLAKLRPYITVK